MPRATNGRTAKRATAPSADKIALRAYEIYISRGGEHGRDLEDWLQAESELQNERAVPRPKRGDGVSSPSRRETMGSRSTPNTADVVVPKDTRDGKSGYILRAVLCFDCHPGTQVRGDFVRHLEAPQVRQCPDN